MKTTAFIGKYRTTPVPGRSNVNGQAGIYLSYAGTSSAPPKAPEDWRTPGRYRAQRSARKSARFWSAPALWRFLGDATFRTCKTQTTAAIITLLFCLGSTSAFALNAPDEAKLATLAHNATSTDSAQCSQAIAQLRAAGPAGLDAMFQVYSERINTELNGAPAQDAAWEQLHDALDSIGQQRDCYASHLYWYTNLDDAKSAARASSKPILSLRLLGKLNEEYTCANSRFFRTTLYPNTQVSQYLRDHFILHWQSVRPVPRITIDMGDGRRIERTITGNSIHYVLDSDGNPIDALPGLYGAKAFLAELDHAIGAEQQASQLTGPARDAFLKNYHSTRLAEIQRQLSRDLAQVTPNPAPYVVSSSSNPFQRPDAVAAAPVAITKSGVEIPLLRRGAQDALTLNLDRLDATGSDLVWKEIAALHFDDAKLDPTAVRLIENKQPPTAAEAARITFSKTVIETPIIRMLRNLQSSIAEDTARNEYQLHSQIHEWFANGTAPTNLDALNSKIYAQLFLTPDSDPWLGLAPSDVFSALDGGGLVQNKNP